MREVAKEGEEEELKKKKKNFSHTLDVQNKDEVLISGNDTRIIPFALVRTFFLLIMLI